MNNKSKKIPPPKTSHFGSLVLVIGGLLALYFIVIQNEKNNSPSSDKLQDNPGLQLAILEEKNPKPNQFTIDFFNNVLSTLQSEYPENTKQQIANALVSGHKIIANNGNSESLLEFAVGFNAFAISLDTPHHYEISSAMAIYIKMEYKT